MRVIDQYNYDVVVERAGTGTELEETHGTSRLLPQLPAMKVRIGT